MISSYIEHTNLSPILTDKDIDRLIGEADQYKFKGICIPPFWVQKARREIGSEPITLITVAGFPLGYNMTETKLEEMQRAIDNGADEVDVVWNLSSFKTNLPWTKIELAKCAQLAHRHQKIIKMIIETAYLANEEIKQACKLCADAGIDFVKTSTGFASTGAQKEHIELMRKCLPDSVGIKASGGIKTYKETWELIQAGANRIGTSAGVNIITEANLVESEI